MSNADRESWFGNSHSVSVFMYVDGAVGVLPARMSCKQNVHGQSLSHTVQKLLSVSDSTVYNALVLIRTKFIKEKYGLRRLRHYGGVKNLLGVAY